MTCFSLFKSCFEIYTGYICIFYNIKHIKSNFWNIFFNLFSSHLSLMGNLLLSSFLYWWKAYFLIFFVNVFQFLQLKSFFITTDRIYSWFFVFYPIERIYIWSANFQIYYMAFVMQQIKTIKDKLIHWCFQPSLISRKKLFKNFLNNFICYIINLDFYLTILWMHSPSSSVSLEKIKLIAIVNRIFHVSDFLRLLMVSFKYGLISSWYYLIDRILFLSPLLSYSI